MKSHRMIKKYLYDYIRGDVSDHQREAIDSHLSRCTPCSAELESIREATKFLDANLQRPNERRSELYWQHFADKVQHRIEQETQERTETSIVQQILDAFVQHRKPFGIGFASAVTLVMITFGIWTLWMKNPVSQTSSFDQTAQQSAMNESITVQRASLDSRAQDYIEQSKVLLIGLMNTDTKALGSSGPLLQREQEISRKLVAESGELTSKLNDPSQRRLKELISDLQLILVQIANLGTHHDLPGVEVIKGGIEHNDMLFKINLEEIQRTTKSASKNDKTVKRTI